MILNESAETRDWKIHVRIPERLSKLIRISREEIAERAKEIHAVEAVRYVGAQSDAIHSSANLPKVFPPCSRIYIADLIMSFATFAVRRIGPPERNHTGDVDLGAERLIRAQDSMAR